MANTLAQWHTEHVNFAKLLDILDAQLDLLHRGDSPHYELMQDIMFYMTHYADVVHHPLEDLAFARIKGREPGASPTIDELTKQHVQLHKLGDDLVRSLGDIMNGTIALRANVEAPARTYVQTLRNHMAVEETKILPMARKLLSDADWTAITKAVEHFEDPLFGRNTAKQYASIRQHLARLA